MCKHLIGIALLVNSTVWAATPQDLLTQYTREAQQQAGFKSFVAARGDAFFHTSHARGQGVVSCTGCHTADPRKPGQTPTLKRIEPMAPAVNPQRFTDAAKTEKWFRRNCQDVLSRVCTAQEKGDVLTYLLSLK